METHRYDYLIIGAGIAGASAGFELSKKGSVLLLEKEHTAGYHSTGRSAAMFTINFDPPLISTLARQSKDFFLNPPEGFTEEPLLVARERLWLAREDQEKPYEDLLQEARALKLNVEEVGRERALTLCPVLREEYFWKGLLETDSFDLDVNAIHQGYLRGLKSRGGSIITNSRITSISKEGDGWVVQAEDASYYAPIIVNAAGAWADEVATLAGVRRIGIKPLQRSMIVFDAPPEASGAAWPFVIDVGEEFYFKLENGRIMASPADQTEVPPSDASPDAYDIAVAADRIQNATTLQIRHIRNSWAGLRSFVADRMPVIGPDADKTGFFWLCAQGGIGIMTAPAAARILAATVDGEVEISWLRESGLSLSQLLPHRVQRGQLV